ncbi:MAG TPA: LptA/OstA family protein [Dissulfurispiraceae bacterium]|nr:LptA/OstA family protein [Dissulfurispiraceae bacterium]
MGNKIGIRSQKSEVRSQKIAPRNYFFRVIIFSVFFFILTSGFCLLTSLSFAEQKNAATPTVITSESLTADNKARTALFTGSVVAKKGDMTLYADRMLVFYSEGGSGSNIDRIEADGNVKLIRGDRVVTAGKAIYYAGQDERAVFTESPRASEGKNVVTGTKMTYYMKDDRSVVENSKVFIVEKEPGTPEKKLLDRPKEKKKK